MNILTSHSTPNSHRKQTGSTLIEVLIALLVFTIGLQGIASMQYQSIKDNFDSTQRSHGVWSAQELINRIRANVTGRANGRYTFNGNPCGLGLRPVPYCADTNAAPSSVCSEAEIATFDIWESICPTPNQSHTQNNSQLFNPNLIINCVGACSEDAEFNLSLQWQSKSVTDDNATDDTLITEQFSQAFRP